MTFSDTTHFSLSHQPADPGNLPEVTPCTSVQDGLTASVSVPRFLIDAMIDGEMLHFTMKNEGNVEIY